MLDFYSFHVGKYTSPMDAMGYTFFFVQKKKSSRHPTSELGHTPLQWDILTIHNLPSWYVGRLDQSMLDADDDEGGVRIVRTFWRLWRLDTPPKFNSLPLRNDGWKATLLLGWYIFRGYVKLPGG